jgi:hypothetical protein
VDEAIRYLARQLRLPGEAQQIDRILEKFASSYFLHNPSFSLSSDTLYILFFSLIMLNTDLHNPSIAKRKKMKLSQFISNLRGINNGKDISKQLLTSLYKRIKRHAISMNDEDMYESRCKEFIAPTKSGWLDKECFFGVWKKRWFILKDGCLFYFTTPLDDHPRAIIPMMGLSISLVEDETNSKSHSFILIVNENNAEMLRICKYTKPNPGKIKSSVGGKRQCFKKLLLLRCKHDDAVAWFDLLSEECHILSEALRLQRQAAALQRETVKSVLGGNAALEKESVVTSDSRSSWRESSRLPNGTAWKEISTIPEESEGDVTSPIDTGKNDTHLDDGNVWGNSNDQHLCSEDGAVAAANKVPFDTLTVDISAFDVSGIDIIECDDDSLGESTEDNGESFNFDDADQSGATENTLGFGIAPEYAEALIKKGDDSVPSLDIIAVHKASGELQSDSESNEEVGVRVIHSARKLQPRQQQPQIQLRRKSLQPESPLHSARSSPHLRASFTGSMRMFGSKYNLSPLMKPNGAESAASQFDERADVNSTGKKPLTKSTSLPRRSSEMLISLNTNSSNPSNKLEESAFVNVRRRSKSSTKTSNGNFQHLTSMSVDETMLTSRSAHDRRLASREGDSFIGSGREGIQSLWSLISFNFNALQIIFYLSTLLSSDC